MEPGDIERAGRRVYMAHRLTMADYRPAATLLGRVVYFHVVPQLGLIARDLRARLRPPSLLR
ncbi:MAG TPA: hypothetical protein VGR62_18110 [Candidatus Binatia bacterium]|jgi:hypothetical protein|nr:hypothetical protein [Candidatus Binatia bacterium]